MKSKRKLKEDAIWEELYPRILILIKKNKWAWQTVCAVLGIAGGILASVAAIILPVIVSWLNADAPVSPLNEISFIFLVLSLPLLALGAHSLDLLEEKTGNLVELDANFETNNQDVSRKFSSA